MSYQKHSVKLSSGQAQNLKKAIETSSPINIKLANSSLKNGNVPLMLTQRQINQINKANKDGKGTVLNISQTQISKMKQDGGILPALLPLLPIAIALLSGAAGAVGTYGTNKAIQAIEKGSKKKKGQALYPPGYQSKEGGRYDTNVQYRRPRSGSALRPVGQTGNALFPTGVRSRR